jgi:hypothetical protein
MDQFQEVSDIVCLHTHKKVTYSLGRFLRLIQFCIDYIFFSSYVADGWIPRLRLVEGRNLTSKLTQMS